METDITNALLYIWFVISSLIAGSTLIVDGLERFAKITPSTKDDQWVSVAKQNLGKLAAILDKVAMSKRNG